jgi:hypothetical protein
MHPVLFAALLVLSLFLSPTLSAWAQDWLSYYPAVARIQGKLIKVQKFGKPTYGENPEKDEKIEVPILVLSTPVRIKASSVSSVNNESLTNVSFVQVIFPPEMEKTWSKHLDQDTLLAGNLQRGRKGDHFTEVVMEVKAVNPTGKPLY